MKTYGYHLNYKNSYQKFSFEISHKAFGDEEGRWILLKGDSMELDDEAILFFEKIFSNILKIAYVDVLNAEIGDLNVWKYDFNGDTIVIHKVIWRHRGDETSYIIYSDLSGKEDIKHLHGKEAIESFFNRLGIQTF